MRVFEIAGVLYTRVIPAKSLFHSTMVHEVVNRGDIFAVRVADGVLTVLDGKLAMNANWFTVSLVPTPAPILEPAKQKTKQKADTVTVAKMKKEICDKLDQMKLELS